MNGGKGVVALADQPSKSRVVKANRKTVAARWNIEVLRRLEATLKKDPETDLASLLPSTYSEKLRSLKRPADRRTGTLNPTPPFHENDIRSRLDTTDPSTVIFKMSTELEGLLRNHNNLSEAIMELLARSEVLYRSAWAASVMVFRVSESVVVKVMDEASAITEYRSLSYLQEHLPSFPAPRPHGVVRLSIYCLLFTTFIPGLDLEKAWPQLDDIQKRTISCQLDTLFSELRSFPIPDNVPFGGVQGEGCKDSRRFLRVNSEPIMNVEQFEDFVFAGSKTASPLYTQLLRDLIPTSIPKCVLTHGDVRPANIMVDVGEDGTWKVVAVIDWESSGFYPEYWECVKMTNNLTPRDNFDWYRYLPESLSLRRYPIRWLVDRLWDRNMVNS